MDNYISELVAFVSDLLAGYDTLMDGDLQAIVSACLLATIPLILLGGIVSMLSELVKSIFRR